jgi:DNA-binding LytR/AlgR family response regulator
MDTLNIAVCDDDVFFAQELKIKIENILLTSAPNITFIIETFSSARELLDNYSRNYSICFLDICLNKENGISAGIKIKKDFPDTILVFVTSFIDFSLEGYKANAFRYILKNSLDNLLPECIKDIIDKLREDAAIIDVNSYGNSISVRANTIVYIESYRHTQTIHLSDKNEIKCSMTLANLQEQTKPLSFIKPHKSYLVNVKYIDCVRKYEILLKTGATIPIALNKYNAFKKEYLYALTKI